ncbi:zinc finger protein 26-like [Melitaea cinxia]|uniref:zinc finger protein 26-like n=1 Tax=Melitaea cinxia TaxID=113334 RepID=UPI001E26FFFC|nr:zinc finger protein 26-like [Melitaea cinxia]
MSINTRRGPIFDPGVCRCCGAIKKCRLLNVEYEWQGQKEIYSDMFVDCYGLLVYFEKPQTPIRKINIDITDNPIKKKEKLNTKKRKRLIKIKLDDKNDNGPIFKRKKRKPHFLTEKSFLNVITVVENSYAYPFNSFFNNYYCAYCRKKFVDCTKLREHSLTHDPTTYKGILTNILKIRENRKCQIDLYRIDCRLCDINIDNLDIFKNHVSTVHGKIVYSEENDFLKFYLTPTNLKCTECNSTFNAFHPLRKHMAEHFGTCICEICGAHYFEERMLTAHMKSHQESDMRSAFSCKLCAKSFKAKYNLKIHVARLHTKESAYLCVACDASFFSNTLCQKHMVNVHGEDCTFKCDQCDKVCINKNTLRDHYKRIHLKILKHECNLCEKRFYLPSRLKEHMTTHTGERNFRCEQCGKSYTRLRALNTHMQSHLTVKKYKCTMCSASFGQNVCLKNHIKRQHQQDKSE